MPHVGQLVQDKGLHEQYGKKNKPTTPVKGILQQEQLQTDEHIGKVDKAFQTVSIPFMINNDFVLQRHGERDLGKFNVALKKPGQTKA